MIGLQFQLPHKLDKRSLRENIALKENSDYKLKGSDSNAEQFMEADKNLHLLGPIPNSGGCYKVRQPRINQRCCNHPDLSK